MATDSKQVIYLWMSRNYHRFVDPQTGEVNYTSLVEGWDNECADGAQTLNADHPAWEIALSVPANDPIKNRVPRRNVR